jgi:hypothetical protein
MKKVIVFLIAYEIANAFPQQKSNDVTTSLLEQSNNFKSPIDHCNHYVG